jgi:predicted permease
MRLWLRIQRALQNLLQGKKQETDLDDEVRAYIEMVADERIAAGMSEAEARRSALLELGGAEQVKQTVRDQRSGVGAEMLLQDLRYGCRLLWRNPGFTVTMVLTLALSIGANTAIFSVVNALMLKSLPYAQPERIGTIFTRLSGPVSSDERHKVDGEQWELLRDNVPSLLSGIASGRTSGVNLQAGTHAQFLRARRLSAHYLDVLGIHPMIGRNFLEQEDVPGGPKAAILSYRLWRDTFDSDRSLVGKTVLLKSEAYTVVGVLAEQSVPAIDVDIYTALQESKRGEGAGTNFDVIARLRDGATWQQADGEINRVWLTRPHPYELGEGPGVQVQYHTVPLQQGVTAKLRPQALTLMLAAGFILLIACANLAGLTLVRMMRRIPEIATRMALGASRWRIQRQLWIESLLLALMGGVAGAMVGFMALRGLLLLLPEGFLPVAGVSLDGRVMAFTLLISLVTSVLFGVLPALAIRRMDLRGAMINRTATGGGHLRLRQTLIVCEVALTVVLLAASGLLIRTLIHLETLPPGFDPEGVMSAKVSLDDVRYHDAAAFRRLLLESTEAMRQIPGVQDVAVGLSLPYERSMIMGDIGVETGKGAGQKVLAQETYVTPDYFRTLRMPILSGRAFNAGDGPETEPVVIINQTFARRFFHGVDPVGHYLSIGPKLRIVGVSGDVQVEPGLNVTAPLTTEESIYIPGDQVKGQLITVAHAFFQPSWVVRTTRPVDGLTGQMQRALAGIDPNLPFSGFYSMHDLMAKTLATQRVEVALLGAMAGLALLLSAVGVFALVANIVAQRTREIGIRIALGSSIRQAMVHVGTPGVRAALLGLTLGLVLCSGVLRAMRSVLYGIGVYDLPTIFWVMATLASVILVAVVVPTLRIGGIDPARTLREE